MTQHDTAVEDYHDQTDVRQKSGGHNPKHINLMKKLKNFYGKEEERSSTPKAPKLKIDEKPEPHLPKTQERTRIRSAFRNCNLK